MDLVFWAAQGQGQPLQSKEGKATQTDDYKKEHGHQTMAVKHAAST
jgi:hypothetical protein